MIVGLIEDRNEGFCLRCWSHLVPTLRHVLEKCWGEHAGWHVQGLIYPGIFARAEECESL